MKKTHFKPEFSVIRQNEANAKFFVASGGSGPQFQSDATTPPNTASSFDSTEEEW